MTLNDWARALFLLGALFAIAGPAIATIRTAAKYSKAKSYSGTIGDLNAQLDPVHVRSTALRAAWWGVAEFGLVGLGVVLTAVASLIVIP